MPPTLRGLIFRTQFKDATQLLLRCDGGDGAVGLSAEEINACGKSGMTALHFAVERWASVDMIRLLIQRGADINAQDRLGRTPLHLATRQPSKVKVLLEVGADPLLKTFKKPEPDSAASIGLNPMDLIGLRFIPAESFHLLLDHMPHLWRPDRDPHRDSIEQLLVRVVWHQRVDLLRSVCAHQADIHYRFAKSGRTVLHEAAFYLDQPMVQELISLGADRRAKDRKGQTPADLAEKRRRAHPIKTKRILAILENSI